MTSEQLLDIDMLMVSGGNTARHEIPTSISW
jgi:hypothetical protein